MSIRRSKSPISGEISSTSDQQQQQQQQYNELLAEQAKQNEQIRAQLQHKLDESHASMEKLHKQFDKYKEEMLATNRILSEEVDTYRTSSSEVSEIKTRIWSFTISFKVFLIYQILFVISINLIGELNAANIFFYATCFFLFAIGWIIVVNSRK